MTVIATRIALACMLAMCPIFAMHDVCAAEGAQRDFFESHIRPVLIRQCVACHGPKRQESDLRVDHISFLRAEANYGRPVVAGKPEESVLLDAIAHRRADLKMPEDQPRLPAATIAKFRQWIRAGAYWPDEAVSGKAVDTPVFDLNERIDRLPWIWQVPRRQHVPAATSAQQAGIHATAIDSFIDRGLRQQRLRQKPAAGDYIWLRRVHFVLTGLPPGQDDIARFDADRFRDRRQRVVDRLLASTAFGERWARHWMDLVRYAESRGHESDFLIANAWRYRDYLIQAFNADVPYDQFVTEHLAGDLVTPPRLSPAGENLSVLGTGWAFLGEEVHSPVNIRQDETDRIDNKVDVLSKTFLGLTVACARCHDHKFDAISQQDYYALCGFVISSNFRQVRYQSMEHNRGVARQLASLERQTRRSMRRELSSGLRNSVNRFSARVLAGCDAQTQSQGEAVSPLESASWRRAIASAAPSDPLHVFAAARQAASLAVLRKRWKQQAAEADRWLENYRVVADYRGLSSAGATGVARHSFYEDGFSFGGGPRRVGEIEFGDPSAPIRAVRTVGAVLRDPFWNKLTLAAGNEKDSSRIKAELRAGRSFRTAKFRLKSGKLHYWLRGKANVYVGLDSHLMVIGPLHGHLVRTVQSAGGWVSHDVGGSEGERAFVEFSTVANEPLEVRMVVEGTPVPPELRPGNPLLKTLVASPRPSDHQTRANRLQRQLQKLLEKLSAESGTDLSGVEAQLLNWMVRRRDLFPVSPASQSRIKQLYVEHVAKRDQLRQTVKITSATAVAWMDGNGIDEHILIRGKHQRRGLVAPRGLPTAFEMPPIETAGSSGRLQLAQQMIDPANPLAARVMVNRVWHHVFGRGIVETVDNFGYLGSRPSHPQLLDHLAWQFANRDRWSIKRLLRRLLLSSTFATSSEPLHADSERLDPDNRWLHRMPVRRLEAEAIRDAVLAISGRLDRSMHGPPIPVHLTEFVVGRGRPKQSGPLDGAGRRSVYTAVRRNFLPTFMLTFDMPAPFSSVGRRNVTNVPAQSLAQMNDAFVFQQSTLWAQRLQRDNPGESPRQRVGRMFRQAFCRHPSTAEVKACLNAMRQFAQRRGLMTVAARPGNAERPSDLAFPVVVWSDLAHALWNTSEFVFIR